MTTLVFPETTAELIETPVSSGASIDTGRAVCIGETERGPTTLQTITSMQQLADVYGPRTGVSQHVHDGARGFFARGGRELTVRRLLADDADTAELVLLGAASAASLTLRAASPGTWGNGAAGGLSADVDVSGSDFTIKVLYNGVEIANSGTLATTAAAEAWYEALTPDLWTLEVDGAADPVATSPTNFAGGTNGTIVTADKQACLTAIRRDFGPCQVVAPGDTTDAWAEMLGAHCEAFFGLRVGLVDVADSADRAAIVAALSAISTGGRCLLPFGGAWPEIDGPIAGSTVPASPAMLAAGTIARLDRERGTQQASAGALSNLAPTVRSVTREYSDADLRLLYEAGLNVPVIEYGQPRFLSFDTLADVATEFDWRQGTTIRIVMEAVAGFYAVADRYKGQPVSDIMSGLERDYPVEVLTPMLRRKAVVGPKETDAWRLVVNDPAVNPVDQLRTGLVKARIVLRPAPHGKAIALELVRKNITETV